MATTAPASSNVNGQSVPRGSSFMTSFRFLRRGESKRNHADENPNVNGASIVLNNNDNQNNGQATEAEVEKPMHPSWEQGASLLNRIFVVWMIPLLNLGTRKQLELHDIGLAPAKDDPEVVYKKLTTHWQEEIENAKKAKREPKLINAIIKVIGYDVLFICLILALLQAAFTTAVPFISQVILGAISGTRIITTAQLWGCVVGIGILPFLAAICQANLMLLSKRATLHLFAALTQAVFVKSLNLSNLSRSTTSTGQAVNIISTDAGTNLERSVFFFFPLVVAPIQLAVLLYLLYVQIGPSMFAGIGVIVVFIPINVMIFGRIIVLQRRAMKLTDERLKVVNELVGAIRIVKMMAWENPLIQTLRNARAKELRILRGHAYWFQLGLTAVFMQLPQILQVIVIATYAFGQSGNFSPTIIFTSIQLFQQIQQPLSQLPNAISTTVQTLTSLRRIQTYLLLPELEVKVIHEPFDPAKPVVSFEHATCSWPKPVKLPEAPKRGQKKQKKPAEEPPAADTTEQTTRDAFTDVHCDIYPGELVIVAGPVGCGKSSLLFSILGETDILKGKITRRGTIGATFQAPWLVTGSIRENITFGSQFDPERYAKVIKECSLTTDLTLFRGGDSCVIGERGINLSGGQKARISLARSLYHASDLLLLDDPLAAVDTHVADTLFESIRNGDLCKGRTRILVTNQLHRLPHADKVLALAADGSLLGYGTYTELIEKGVKFDLIVDESKDNEAEEKKEEKPTTPAESESRDQTPIPLGKTPANGEEDDDEIDEAEVDDKVGEMEQKAKDVSDALTPPVAETNDKKDVADKLYQVEERGKGRLGSKVYMYYFTRYSGAAFLFTVITQATFLFAPAIAVLVLSNYSTEYACQLTQGSPNQSSQCKGITYKGMAFYVGAYIIIQCVGFLICIIASICVAELRVAISKLLHEDLIKAVFQAPIAYFDVTPMGRVLNRFSKDINVIDTTLMQMLAFALMMVGIVFSEFIIMAVATQGFFLIVLVVAVYAYNKVFQYARCSAIEIQRIEAITRSPIYSSFSEVLTGLYTIRAFNASKRFERANVECVRENLPSYYIAKTALSSFLTVWLNVVGALLAFCVAAIVVSATIPAGYAGVSLTYAMLVTQQLYMFTFMATEAEVQMNSVERIKELVESIPKENFNHDNELSDKLKNSQWPEKGEIRVQNLVLGYRQGPDVIHSITFTINAGERVGVVGRTGSGKSTLFLSFLRIVEPRSGAILIDNVDITKVSLELLRSRIGLIPQDPALFLGTIRFNLDPFDSHTDDEVWDALKRVQLDQFISDQPMKLLAPVQEAGSNLSQGQKQLIAIARSLLRKNNIILMDEATASVDLKADAFLQQMMRDNFVGKTVIAIAHRLDTIMDSDRVLVLDKGHIVEYDEPHLLLGQHATGHLRSMVDVTGKASSRHLRQIASSAYMKKHGSEAGSFFTKKPTDQSS